MTNPWIKFYPSDWRADPALRMCSIGARGLWMEMLCIMHEAGGYLTVNGKELQPRQLAVLTGSTVDEVASFIEELSDAGVFSRDERGVIFSRRMLKDIAKAEEDRAAGKKGGSPKLTGGYNIPGYIYLMGVRADGAYKIGISTNPSNRLKKVRAQYPGQDIRVLGTWPVADMGATEARVHQMFAGKKDGEWFALERDDIETLNRTLKGPSQLSHGETLKAQKPEARSQTPDNSETKVSGVSAENLDLAANVVVLSDPRADLFGRGLKILTALTGRPEGQLRGLLGKWLKAANDDAVKVLRIVEDAARSRVADAVPWIEAALKDAPKPKSAYQSEVEKMRRWL